MLDPKDSTTYQAILRKGREEGRIATMQHFLLRLGTKRFGKPSPVALAAFEAIQDIERLEALADRVIDPDVGNWDALLEAP